MRKKNKGYSSQQENRAFSFKPSRAQIAWFIVIVLLVFIFPGYGRHKFSIFNWFGRSSAQTTEVEYDSDNTYGLDNIELVGNWTREDYQNLGVATVKYDSDYEVEDYYGGDSFADLEKKVGRPSSVYRNDDGDFETITATWNYDSDTDYISIDIIYLEESNMIIDKYIYGSQND